MLEALHTELTTYIGAKLPGVTAAAYTPDFRTRRGLTLPACLIELATIEPFSDFGNRRDKSRVALDFEARLLVDPNVADGWIDLKEFAAVVWWALRDFAPQTAGVGPINLRRAGEDAFKPGLDGFLVWLIEFDIEAYIDFAAEEVLPTLSKLTANVTPIDEVEESHPASVAVFKKHDVPEQGVEPHPADAPENYLHGAETITDATR